MHTTKSSHIAPLKSWQQSVQHKQQQHKPKYSFNSFKPPFFSNCKDWTCQHTSLNASHFSQERDSFELRFLFPFTIWVFSLLALEICTLSPVSITALFSHWEDHVKFVNVTHVHWQLHFGTSKVLTQGFRFDKDEVPKYRQQQHHKKTTNYNTSNYFKLEKKGQKLKLRDTLLGWIICDLFRSLLAEVQRTSTIAKPGFVNSGSWKWSNQKISSTKQKYWHCWARMTPDEAI